MKGPEGYGRYDDDPSHVGCPRAQTDMTPCVARDGNLAIGDSGRCVGCGELPRKLLQKLAQALGRSLYSAVVTSTDGDRLKKLVWEATEGLGSSVDA